MGKSFAHSSLWRFLAASFAVSDSRASRSSQIVKRRSFLRRSNDHAAMAPNRGGGVDPSIRRPSCLRRRRHLSRPPDFNRMRQLRRGDKLGQSGVQIVRRRRWSKDRDPRFQAGRPGIVLVRPSGSGIHQNIGVRARHEPQFFTKDKRAADRFRQGGSS